MEKENNTNGVNSELIGEKTGDNSDDISSEKMKSDFNKWGVGLIILGILHIILPDVLSLVWGFCLIVAGICNFIFKSKAMYIVNGITLCFVGVMNLTFTLLEGDNYIWVFFGILQIYWGAREILKYKKVRTDVEEELKEDTKDELSTELNFQKKYSKFGIASFVIFCINVILALGSFVFIIVTTDPNGLPVSDDSPEAIITGFLFMFWALLLVVGIALGIAGLFEKDKNRIYAILGICLNCFLLLIIVFPIVFLTLFPPPPV